MYTSRVLCTVEVPLNSVAAEANRYLFCMWQKLRDRRHYFFLRDANFHLFLQDNVKKNFEC